MTLWWNEGYIYTVILTSQEIDDANGDNTVTDAFEKRIESTEHSVKSDLTDD